MVTVMIKLSWFCLIALYCLPVMAERLEIDRGIRAAGLWSFPLLDKPNDWVYLPSKARLALDDQGRPQFSFMRYVENRASTSGSDTITDASGGGVLHFLVLYETPEEQIAQATEVLREKTGNKELSIRGPVVFDKGRYALVSSIVGDTGKTERKLITTGNAPVLEGNRLALSFDLTTQQATLLLNSFQMATPDVSLNFDLGFSGIVDAYDARMVVDWSEVRKSKTYSAGASVYFVSADVEAQIEDMIRNNAIKLESRGSDATMEALLSQVYDKLLTLLFRPVEPERVPKEKRGGLMDALESLTGSDGSLSSRNTTGFGAYVGYQVKDIRSKGVTVLDFNHRASVDRHHFIAFNIGDLYQRYGTNKNYFRDINIEDPVFLQREVHVAVDGDLLPEFSKLINSVTVTLRKVHENGVVTLRELVLDRNTFDQDDKVFKLIYGWDEDEDREQWLNYDFRTHWSFKGGGKHETDWYSTNAAMIDLFAPYERRTIQAVDAGVDMNEEGIRAIIVAIEHPFFGGNRKQQMVIRGNQGLQEPSVEITLPRNSFDYQYSMTWINNDGSRQNTTGRDDSGLIFLDLPPSE